MLTRISFTSLKNFRKFLSNILQANNSLQSSALLYISFPLDVLNESNLVCVVTVSFVDLVCAFLWWHLNLKYVNQYGLCKLESRYGAFLTSWVMNMDASVFCLSVLLLALWYTLIWVMYQHLGSVELSLVPVCLKQCTCYTVQRNCTKNSLLLVNIGSVCPSAETVEIYVICHKLSQILTSDKKRRHM